MKMVNCLRKVLSSVTVMTLAASAGAAEITLDDIFELHRIITDRLLDKTRNGKIRKNPVYIENEKHDILYTAAEPEKVEAELRELIDWIRESQFSVHPVIIAGIMHFRMAVIHPFADGNGRMSRLLTLLLLYNTGYDVGKYVSLENIINKNKDMYYQKLYESSSGWSDNHNSYWPFIENFLMTLLSAYNELARRYEIIKDKKLSKAQRVEETIKTTLGKITKEEIHEIWPDISVNTIELELAKLLKEGLIEKVGNTNGVAYFWKGK